MCTRRFSALPIVAVGLAFSASAQSIDTARQLFESARYAEAKSELTALDGGDRNAAAAYYLGRIAGFENDGEEAVRQLERAVALEERNAVYHLWLGNALRDEAQHAGALKALFMGRRMKKEWERALDLDPGQVEARFGLVQFLAFVPGPMGGSKDQARAQAAEIARRNPARGAMARALIALAEKDAAAEVAAYQQAIAAAPDTAEGYFALGHAYARDGKLTRAFETLDQYARRHPDDRWPSYQTGRFAGIAGLELDRGENALRGFLAAPAPDAQPTNLAAAHYWLGQIAEKRGAKEAAREEYRTALQINPRSRPARRALDQLH